MWKLVERNILDFAGAARPKQNSNRLVLILESMKILILQNYYVPHCKIIICVYVPNSIPYENISDF